MQQSGEAWHQFRSRGLGSSDAPTVMGVSPWRTPYQLWCEKTGLVKREFQTNWAIDRGNRLEPKARARYEIVCGLEFSPAVFVHPEYEFIRASLDGFNKETNTVLEIKCPGAVDHENAKMGKVPEKYVWQVYHQMLASGANEAHYFSYYEDNDGNNCDHALVVVKRNEEMIESLKRELIRFWGMVERRIVPPLTHKDSMDVTNDEKTKDLIERLLGAKRNLDESPSKTKALRTELDSVKQAALKCLPHSRVRFGNVEIVKMNETSLRIRNLNQEEKTDEKDI